MLKQSILFCAIWNRLKKPALPSVALWNKTMAIYYQQNTQPTNEKGSFLPFQTSKKKKAQKDFTRGWPLPHSGTAKLFTFCVCIWNSRSDVCLCQLIHHDELVSMGHGKADRPRSGGRLRMFKQTLPVALIKTHFVSTGGPNQATSVSALRGPALGWL